jgi:thiol-disulfide isomerase/thioredoxin
LAALTLAACGGAGGPGDDGPDLRGAYPAGPYGVTEGALLEAHAFVLPDGGTRTFEDVWKDGTKKLLMVVTSADWCTACIEEQPQLRRYHQDYSGKGLAIIQAIFEDGNSEPATSADADRWQRTYELPFDMVADTPFVLGAYYDETLTPMNMIVDVTEMKIMRISTGLDPNAIEAILDARLE